MRTELPSAVVAELARAGFLGAGSPGLYTRASIDGRVSDALVLELADGRLLVGYSRFHEPLPLELVRHAHATNPGFGGLIDERDLEGRTVLLSKHFQPSTFAAELQLFAIPLGLDGDEGLALEVLESRLSALR